LKPNENNPKMKEWIAILHTVAAVIAACWSIGRKLYPEGAQWLHIQTEEDMTCRIQ